MGCRQIDVMRMIRQHSCMQQSTRQTLFTLRGIDVNVRKRKLKEVFITTFKVVCILDDGVPSDCCDEDDLASLMYAAINNNTNIIQVMM